MLKHEGWCEQCGKLLFNGACVKEWFLVLIGIVLSYKSYKAPFCNRDVHTCAHFCDNIVHCVTQPRVGAAEVESLFKEYECCCVMGSCDWTLHSCCLTTPWFPHSTGFVVGLNLKSIMGKWPQLIVKRSRIYHLYSFPKYPCISATIMGTRFSCALTCQLSNTGDCDHRPRMKDPLKMSVWFHQLHADTKLKKVGTKFNKPRELWVYVTKITFRSHQRMYKSFNEHSFTKISSYEKGRVSLNLQQYEWKRTWSSGRHFYTINITACRLKHCWRDTNFP